MPRELRPVTALQPNYVTACRRRRELISPLIAFLPTHRHRRNTRSIVLCDGNTSAAIAQLVARRPHNPKVVSSTLADRMHVPNRRMKRETEYIGCEHVAQRAAPRHRLYSFQVRLPRRSRHRASPRRRVRITRQRFEALSVAVFVFRLRLRCLRLAQAGHARHDLLVPSLPPCNRTM